MVKKIEIAGAKLPGYSRAKLGREGFTLTELLVVMLTLGVLAALILPALAATRPNSHAFQCLANMKQLQMASQLYANDNNDFLPGNLAISLGGYFSGTVNKTPPIAVPSWVGGVMGTQEDGSGDIPLGCSTNDYFLGTHGDTVPGLGTLIGSIGSYAKASAVYKCPADKSIDKFWQAPRVRSCSANMYAGADYGEYVSGTFGYNTSYKPFYKYSDFSPKLSPAQCFIFLDQTPNGLNDGYFEYVANGSGVNDRPAANHGNSSSFSFADGHAELHQWADAYLSPTGTGTIDTHWIAQHGTCLK